MTSISAVIFDMDGLLIDTETAAKHAWQEAANLFGEQIDDELLHRLIGRHIDDALAIIGEAWGRDIRNTEFMARVDDIYFANFMRNGINVKTGASCLLQELSDRDTPRAVATSSEKEIAPRKLRLAGLEHYFPLIVSGCEVDQSKPAPDIFLLTAERLNIDPGECLVLEDSYAGIQGAVEAGMSAIMIPDVLPPTEEMEQLTIGIYQSLADAHPMIMGMLSETI